MRTPIIHKPIRRSNSLPQTPTSRSAARHRLLSRAQTRQSITESPAELETTPQDDTASQVLSMTRDTADTIVTMMKILHKRLQPHVTYDRQYHEYSENEQDRDLAKGSRKSILKTRASFNLQDRDIDSGINSPQHTVKIDQNRNVTNFYDGVDQAHLLSKYSFSPEFNDVYAELVDT